MVPELKSYLITYLQNETFSLVNDGSSDTGLKKMNATCALMFDIKRSKKVEFKFYDMCSTSGEDASKAETLFSAIDGALERDKISWQRCVAFGVDNCNCNIDDHNSLTPFTCQSCKFSTNYFGSPLSLASLSTPVSPIILCKSPINEQNAVVRQ